jgi:hypothetical protein
MRWLARFQTIYRSLVRPKQVENELDAELDDHFQREIESGIRSGLSPEEARLAALRLFGSVSLFKEECRDARGIGFVENLARERCASGNRLLAVLTAILPSGKLYDPNITIF